MAPRFKVDAANEKCDRWNMDGWVRKRSFMMIMFVYTTAPDTSHNQLMGIIM